MHQFKSAILEKLKKLKRIYAGKSTKRGFSKKAITRIEFFLLFQVPKNPLKAWNAKLEAASFFTV